MRSSDTSNMRYRYFGLSCLSKCVVLFTCGLVILALTIEGRCESIADGVGVVKFFEKAVVSPPDIEEYVVCQRELQGSSVETNTVVCFKGARSGTNFYLWTFTGTNTDFGTNQRAIIVGRSGSVPYSISGQIAAYGIGSNGFSENVNWNYGMTRQFLAMGIGDLLPNSITWSNNFLVATNKRKLPQFGELVTLNGLPFEMKFSKHRSFHPFKVIQYTYPKPVMALGGYPERMVISSENGGVLMPVIEMKFISVKLAPKPLASAYFDPRKFAYRFKYTNIFSNSDYYIEKIKSKNLIKAPTSLLESGGYTNSRPRLIVIICLVVVSIISLVAIIWNKNRNR